MDSNATDDAKKLAVAEVAVAKADLEIAQADSEIARVADDDADRIERALTKKLAAVNEKVNALSQVDEAEDEAKLSEAEIKVAEAEKKVVKAEKKVVTSEIGVVRRGGPVNEARLSKAKAELEAAKLEAEILNAPGQGQLVLVSDDIDKQKAKVQADLRFALDKAGKGKSIEVELDDGKKVKVTGIEGDILTVNKSASKVRALIRQIESRISVGGTKSPKAPDINIARVIAFTAPKIKFLSQEELTEEGFNEKLQNFCLAVKNFETVVAAAETTETKAAETETEAEPDVSK